MVQIGIAPGTAAGSRSPLKAAFSLDPAKRILLYSGVVQHYKFCSYYVTFQECWKFSATPLLNSNPRLAANPGRTRFLAGDPGGIQVAAEPVQTCYY
jgi:hypothetical protein